MHATIICHIVAALVSCVGLSQPTTGPDAFAILRQASPPWAAPPEEILDEVLAIYTGQPRPVAQSLIIGGSSTAGPYGEFRDFAPARRLDGTLLTDPVTQYGAPYGGFYNTYPYNAVLRGDRHGPTATPSVRPSTRPQRPRR